MQESPATRASLLVRLRDANDAEAWREFARLYAPVIYGFARKRGLQDADAADLMQEVLRSVSTAMGRLDYDAVRGTFRGWLFGICRNKVFGERRRRHTQPAMAEAAVLEQQFNDLSRSQEAMSEELTAIARRALALTRSAFWTYAVFCARRALTLPGSPSPTGIGVERRL